MGNSAGIFRIAKRRIWWAWNALPERCARKLERLPIIRMTNVSLLPGTWDYTDLIADTHDGILMETIAPVHR